MRYSFASLTEKKICVVRELITQPFKDLKCNLMELKKYDNVSNCQAIYLLLTKAIQIASHNTSYQFSLKVFKKQF